MRSAGVIAMIGLATLPAAGAAQEARAYRLTLGDAARLAAERSTPVLEARARTDGAHARVRGSLSSLLPSVNADFSQSARTFNTASFGLDFPTIPGQPPFFDPEGEVLGPIDATDFRARAVVPLLDFGAIADRRSAIADADAAREEEGAVADASATGAARSYVVTLTTRAVVAAREQDLSLAEELLHVARELVEAGVGVAIDVTRAQAQVATVRAQLLAARHDAEISELTLRRALRIPDEASVELLDHLESMVVEPLPVQGRAVEEALDRRSDLSAAEAYRAAARQSVSATRAERLPRVTAYLDDGYYGGSYRRLLNTYSWTFRLSLPLFDGLDRSSRARAQEARVREIGYRIQDLEDEVAFQVREALLSLASAQEQASAAGERLRLADLEVSQEEERLRAGVAGTGDVVRAAVRLNEARTAHVRALSAVQAFRVSLAAAMGTVSSLP
jgi:outer membrane protein